MTSRQKLLFLLPAVVLSIASYGQTSKKMTDYLNVPGPIIFDNKAYNLTWSSHPAANFYKHEYVMKGDTVTKFKSMILVDVLTGNLSLKEVTGAKIEELKKIKQGNPAVTYEIFQNASTGEYMIDFLLTANAPDGTISIVERNVYRYKTFTDKSGKKGILLFGISTRSYGNDIASFFTSLKNNKADLVNKTAKFTIPAITLAR
jgi:hypothetical protein